MVDEETIGIVVALGALAAAVGALMSRDSGSRVFNVTLPESNQPLDPNDTPNAPEDLPSPGDSGGASTDVPEEEPPGGRGPTASPSSSTIPDSLSAFDPAGRVDLVNQPSTVDGEEQEHTWVGL